MIELPEESPMRRKYQLTEKIAAKERFLEEDEL
jgi:hypothetical protein